MSPADADQIAVVKARASVSARFVLLQVLISAMVDPPLAPAPISVLAQNVALVARTFSPAQNAAEVARNVEQAANAVAAHSEAQAPLEAAGRICAPAAHTEVSLCRSLPVAAAAPASRVAQLHHQSSMVSTEQR